MTEAQERRLAALLFGPNPNATRKNEMEHPVWASLLWSVLIIVVFRTLSVRKYRSATA